MAGQDLKALADRAVAEIAAAADEAALEAARVKYLGRKGALSEATKGIAKLQPSEKPAFGAALNEAKGRIEAALNERGAALRAKTMERDLGAGREDMTLPPRRVLELSSQTIAGDVWQNLSIDRYRSAKAIAVLPVVILADKPAVGLAAVRETPDAGVAKHREYSLTWFSLATLTLVLWIALNLRRAR